MEPIPIWLDCDPGHDDAFAILLATHSKKVELIGISIVHGNDSVANCAKNALRMMWAYGVKGVPVYNGLQRPLIREPKYCPEIHGIPGEQGVAGMCGYHFPDDQIFNPGSGYFVNEETHGVLAMSEAILTHPRKVTVVLTGAQTNLAFALRMFPELKGKIEKVVFMGGAIGLGNTGVAAEFNMQIDPEAASIVFHSGIPLVMIPLEVTHKVLATPAILQRLANIDNETLLPLPDSPSPLPPKTLPHRHVEYGEVAHAVDRRKRMDMTSPSDPTTGTKSVNDTDADGTGDPPKFSSTFALCCHQLLTFFQGTYYREFGFSSPPLHDPCTIFYLTHPQAFHTLSVYIDVETGSEKCAGRTLVDMNNLGKEENNVLLCTNIDTDHFWQNMLFCLKEASKNSPMNN